MRTQLARICALSALGAVLGAACGGRIDRASRRADGGIAAKAPTPDLPEVAEDSPEVVNDEPTPSEPPSETPSEELPPLDDASVEVPEAAPKASMDASTAPPPSPSGSASANPPTPAPKPAEPEKDAGPWARLVCHPNVGRRDWRNDDGTVRVTDLSCCTRDTIPGCGGGYRVLMAGTCKTNLPQCVSVGYPVAPIGVYGPEVPIPGGVIVDIYPGRTRPTELIRLGYISYTQLAPAGTFGPKAVAITTGWSSFASVTSCSIGDSGGSCSLQGGEAGGYRSRMYFEAGASGATFWSLRASYTGCEGKGGLKMVHGNYCTAFPIDGGSPGTIDGGSLGTIDGGPAL